MAKEKLKVPIKEVAERLGITYQTVLNWHFNGSYKKALPIRKAVNGRLYCYADDLEKFAKHYIV